jgi:hypothetical protein
MFNAKNTHFINLASRELNISINYTILNVISIFYDLNVIYVLYLAILLSSKYWSMGIVIL